MTTDSGAPTELLQTPWYRRTRWLLLILLLFPYLAALMVWRFKPDWPKLARYATYVYGAIVGLVILVGLVAPRSQSQTAQATPVPIQAVAAAAPTSVPAPPATLAPTAAPERGVPVEPTPDLPAQATATPARLVVIGAGAEVPAVAPSAAALAEPLVAPATPNARPSGQAAPQGGSCPSGFPIKGNHSASGELIYHPPGGQFYNRTNPEDCFATAGAAVAAGYRASLR